MKFLFLLFIVLSIIPVWAQTENYTYKLTQSTANFAVWTTTPAVRVFQDAQIPSQTGSNVMVYCAKDEFEPYQIIVKPTNTGNLTINMGDFGSGITSEIYQVKYVNITQVSDNLGQSGKYPDPLWPVENNTQVAVTANQNTAFWVNVYVPTTTASGNYTANFTIGSIVIPVKLHVFNFTMPDRVHVNSLMYFSDNAVLSKYGVTGTGTEYWMYVDKIKQFFIDHHLTPSNPLWSGGLTSNGGGPYITYDCNGKFTDNNGIWGFEQPVASYINGNKLRNKTGFPSFMAATFQNNDASADQRPATFCSVAKSTSDWYTGNNPGSTYNQKWFAYISAMQNYLSGLNLLDKSYYYFANEPQDQTDYDAVAWYSQELKKAAPNLKLMVSEEPTPEIYNHSVYKGAKIDIWLPVLNNYNPNISFAREKDFGEHTWIYFLRSTRPPFFNPITLDHPGIESKFTGWFLWKYRLKGLAYYSMNNWSQNPWTDPFNSGHNGELFMLYPPSETNTNIAYGSNNHKFVPSVRVELMRDGLEDFEYLYMLNNNAMPQVNITNTADIQCNKIIAGLNSYTRDEEFMYNLRRLIGLKLGGEIQSIPDIFPANLHPRSLGAPDRYYINFQDPNGEPKTNPLVVNNKTYLKIGWNTYDKLLGYGWYGDMAHVMYQYLTTGPNVLQNSIIYDDWGRQKTFEFDLPNGTYNVTASVGWKDKTYSHHKIKIEGVDFINDEATTPQNPYLVRTKQVTITDYKLTMEMGIFDQYTMLNYLEIESTTTGTGSINPDHFLISPNPATESIKILFTNKTFSDYKLEIIDCSGKTMYKQIFNNCNEINLNTSKFLSGLYIVKVINKQQNKVLYSKIIIK